MLLMFIGFYWFESFLPFGSCCSGTSGQFPHVITRQQLLTCETWSEGTLRYSAMPCAEESSSLEHFTS